MAVFPDHLPLQPVSLLTHIFLSGQNVGLLSVDVPPVLAAQRRYAASLVAL